MWNTRFAPSPTGDMHLGNLRTLYFNWLTAKSSGGNLLLRIDDTDMDRNKETSVDVIFDIIGWLDLDYDRLFYQSKRRDIYLQLAYDLIDAKMAHFDTNGAIILDHVDGMPTSWTDNVAGDIKITDHDHKIMDGMVLLRGGDKRHSPTYNFASIVDDYFLGINYIIRGKDHISNTAKQIKIWTALNHIRSEKPLPAFAHLGLLTQNKKKLSKREESSSVMFYKNSNIHPEALLNFILRMGWGPFKDDKTSKNIDKARALTMFLTEGKMRNSDANVDLSRLDAYNRYYNSRDENKEKV